MSELFKVSSNPHIRSKVTTSGIMLAVILALMPATGYGIYNFGARAAAVVLVTVASTVLTEFLFGLYKKKLTITAFDCDAYTGATPLAALKAGEQVNVMDMVIGRTAGTIGETSAIALIIGACLLILLGVIDLRIPGSYIVSFLILVGIFGGHGFEPAYLAAQLAGGGLMLGAFFMATDYVTRPITIGGQYLFGIFLGVMTGIFRIFGPGAEGVSYAIILGNLLVPLIERITKPTAFGYKRGGGRHEK